VTSAGCGFPGVLLLRWLLRACCYRRGSAAAARSRATDAAMTRAHPVAILGLRRCTARAIQGTWITAFGASTAIASTVSRRGQRRPHHTPMTIPTAVKASLYRGVFVALKRRRTAIGGALGGAPGGGLWVSASGRQPGPRCQARAPGPPFAAAACSVPCSVAPQPGSALPCRGPRPPARSQQRSSRRPGPAVGARRPSARPRQRPG